MSTPTTTAASAEQRSSWPKVAAIAAAATAVVLLFVLAFTWPVKTMEAKNLPVSIAGSEELVDQFQEAIESTTDGTFDFHAAADRDEAEQQIKERETYGAIVFHELPEAPEVLTAPASNSAATQMITGLGQNLQQQLRAQLAEQADQLEAAAQNGAELGPEQQAQLQALRTQSQELTVNTTAVVPLSEDDPQGAGLAAASLPLIMGGMIGGAMLSLLVKNHWRRLAGAGIYSVLVGLGLTLVNHTWLGFVQGDFALNWLAFSVSAAATAVFILGMVAVIGPGGIGVGALVTMLIGNPLSGANYPWQFIPEPFGWLGQFFVPGASLNLLRTISYFPDAPEAQQWWTLVAWIAAGVALTFLGHWLKHRHDDDPERALPAGAGAAESEAGAPGAVAAGEVESAEAAEEDTYQPRHAAH